MKLPGTSDKSNCCGCGVCMSACRKNAISMQEDKRGFRYPAVDEDLCVNCGACEKVCPFINEPKTEEDKKLTRVLIHHDKEICLKSSSGGAFSAIIEAYTADHPDTYVAGVRWDDDFGVCNDITNDKDKIQEFHKSKYILSNTDGIYERTKKILDEGHSVIFSGTPCQNAALRNHLKKEYGNLLLVDIVCHGAPSNKLFKKHIYELNQKKEIDRYEFRDKQKYFGMVRSRSVRIFYKDGSSRHFEENDAYLALYYSRLAYRESCGCCRYAKPERVSDITICDAHNIEQVYGDLNVGGGVSVIIYHTDKALELEKGISKLAQCRELAHEWIVSKNDQLRKPTKLNKNTSLFFRLLDRGFPFGKAVRKTTGMSAGKRIKISMLPLYLQIEQTIRSFKNK